MYRTRQNQTKLKIQKIKKSTIIENKTKNRQKRSKLKIGQNRQTKQDKIDKKKDKIENWPKNENQKKN